MCFPPWDRVGGYTGSWEPSTSVCYTNCTVFTRGYQIVGVYESLCRGSLMRGFLNMVCFDIKCLTSFLFSFSCDVWVGVVFYYVL